MPALRNVRHNHHRVVQVEDANDDTSFHFSEDVSLTSSPRNPPYVQSPTSSRSSLSPLALPHASLPEDPPSPDSSSDSDYATQQSPARRNHSKKRDPGHVPRPPNAFFCFRSAYWQIEREKPQAVRDNRQVSCKAADVWRDMSEEQRKPYLDMANKIKYYHALKYPEYRYAPSSQSKRQKSSCSKKKPARAVSLPSEQKRRREKRSRGNTKSKSQKENQPPAPGDPGSVAPPTEPLSAPTSTSPSVECGINPPMPVEVPSPPSLPSITLPSVSDQSLSQYRDDPQSTPAFTFPPDFAAECEVPSYTLPPLEESVEDKYTAAYILSSPPQSLTELQHFTNSPVLPNRDHILHNTFLVPHSRRIRAPKNVPSPQAILNHSFATQVDSLVTQFAQEPFFLNEGPSGDILLVSADMASNLGETPMLEDIDYNMFLNFDP